MSRRRRRADVAGLPAALAAGPHDRRARRDDRAGAPVVADRQVLPVGQQRVAVGAEDPADVGGVVLGGVEVDVVGDLERQVQRRPRRAATVGAGLERARHLGADLAPRLAGPARGTALSDGARTRGARSRRPGRAPRPRTGRRPGADRRRPRRRRTAGGRARSRSRQRAPRRSSAATSAASGASGVGPGCEHPASGRGLRSPPASPHSRAVARAQGGDRLLGAVPPDAAEHLRSRGRGPRRSTARGPRRRGAPRRRAQHGSASATTSAAASHDARRARRRPARARAVSSCRSPAATAATAATTRRALPAGSSRSRSAISRPASSSPSRGTGPPARRPDRPRR